MVNAQRAVGNIIMELAEEFNVMFARNNDLIKMWQPSTEIGWQRICFPHRKQNPMLAFKPALADRKSVV
jgi:hypothetical protein